MLKNDTAMRQALVTSDKCGEQVDEERGVKQALTSTTTSMSTIPKEHEAGEGILKGLRETLVSDRVTAGVAIGAVCSAVTAMAIEQSVVVVAAGILSSILSLSLHWQQTRVVGIEALHEASRSIQAEVEELHADNRRLVSNVDELKTSVQHLEDVQQVLVAITSTQDSSIEAFQKQIANSENVLKQMQTNVTATVLQNLLSVAFRADTDGNVVIDDAEALKLVRRINVVPGINLNEVKLRAAITGKSFDSILSIVEDILSEKSETSVDTRIFERSQ